MTMEQMFSMMSISNAMIRTVSLSIGCEKMLPWNYMSQHSPITFFDITNSFFEKNKDCDLICTADWCFDQYTITSIFDIVDYADKMGYYVIALPELGLCIICRDENTLKSTLKKLPKEYLNKSIVNIDEVELLEDSVLIKYYDHIEQKIYDERPAYVNDLIERERLIDEAKAAGIDISPFLEKYFIGKFEDINNS
jgi:hypothetical protein